MKADLSRYLAKILNTKTVYDLDFDKREKFKTAIQKINDSVDELDEEQIKIYKRAEKELEDKK